MRTQGFAEDTVTSGGPADCVIEPWPVGVGDAPGSRDDLMFWQFPCRTEGDAAQRHRAIRWRCARPQARPNVYLALPWATWIDKAGLDPLALQLVGSRLQRLRRQALATDAPLQVHTVCQHIYWERLLPVWKELGVTDLWLSHATEHARTSAATRGIRVHPWSLFAVNVEDPRRRKGLEHPVPPWLRTHLASFVGSHMPHYVSDVRLRLNQLRHVPGFVIDVREDKWHFEDVVYGHQVRHEPLASSYRIDASVVTYNRALAHSRFALCPSGAGPNSLRLWEALALGCVPVLLGEHPLLPRGGTLPAIDWSRIVIAPGSEVPMNQLPTLLSAIPMADIVERSELARQAYAMVRRQTCF